MVKYIKYRPHDFFDVPPLNHTSTASLSRILHWLQIPFQTATPFVRKERMTENLNVLTLN